MAEQQLIYANVQNEKIGKTVTNFARIIVCGTVEKPYYNILWYDPDDREYHIGFGSYELGFVHKWLKEEFEVVGDGFSNEPVVHGRWGYREYRTDMRITVSGEVVCSNCHAAYFRVRGHWFKFCPHCGAKMGGARAKLDGGAAK